MKKTFFSVKFTFVCLVALSSILLGSRVMAQEAPSILPEPPVSSASEFDYPPFSVVTEEGKADGFSVELLRAALKAMKKDVTFKVGQWSEIKQELADGKIEVLPLVGRTPEREDIYDFSISYLSMHGAIFVRDNESSIKGVKDLKNKEVLVMEGDNAYEYLSSHKVSNHIKPVASFKIAFELLASGKYDAVVAQKLLGLQLIKSLEISNVKTVGPPLDAFVQSFCFAVPEGEKHLLATLNEGLAIVIANGTHEKLKQKWFGPLMEKESPAKLILQALTIILVTVLITGFIAFVWQNSLRKQVQEKTKEILAVTKLQQTFFDLADDAIYLIDVESRTLIDVNASAIKRLGYSKEELIGKPLSDINGELSKEAVAEKLKVQAQTGAITFETIHKTKSGHLIPVEIANSLFELNGKKVLLSFARDITARKEFENELKKAKSDAEEANYAKSVFLANMSHEIRTPLNAVIGFTQIMMEEATKPQDKEFLDIIYNGGQSLLKLITDILDFSKIESGKIEAVPFPHNLKDLFIELSILFANELQKKGLSVRIIPAPEDLPLIILDHSILQQILNNLINNAIKFTPEGEVKVELEYNFVNAEKRAVDLTFKVSDTGIGIDEKNKNLIFQAFEQIKGKNSTFTGTGLGLAISKKLALALGGEITFTSNEPRGSVFFLSLKNVSTADIAEGHLLKTSEG